MLHQIGAGALGPVFRAYQPEPGRLVAVKLFRLDLPPERAHKLVAEFERLVAADLSHPAIAAPIGTGLSDVTPYLAQDFVTADSLDVVIRDSGSLPPAEVGRVAAHFGAALDFAADHDIHHGALHPRDVMLSADDVRITGFGVARALEQVGVTTPVRRPYSAPERAVGGPWDSRADMFSFAALIFELLFGRRVSGAGERAVASLPEIAGTSRAALKRVFAKALSGDPGGRYQSGAAFADALQSALAQPVDVAIPSMLDAGDAQPARSRPAKTRAPKKAAVSDDLSLDDADLQADPPALQLPLGADALDIDRVVPAAPLADVPIAEAVDIDAHEHALNLAPDPVEVVVPPLDTASPDEHALAHPEVAATLTPIIDEPDTAAADSAAPGFVTAPLDLSEPEAAVEHAADLSPRAAETPMPLTASSDSDDVRAVEAAASGIEEWIASSRQAHAHPGGLAELPLTDVAADHGDSLELHGGVPADRTASDDDHPLHDDGRGAPAPFSQALESTRSALWPIVLAFVIGGAVVFGIVVLFFTRGNTPSSDTPISADARPAPTVIEEPALAPPATIPTPAAPAPSGAAPAPPTSTGAVPPVVSEPAGRAAAPSTPASSAGSTPAPPPAASAPTRPAPAAAERPRATTGRVQVRSTPSGARVTIDGRAAGVTPLTVPSVSFGAHTVRVQRDGYVATERRASVSADRPTTTVNVDLARTPAPRAPRPAAVPPAPPAADGPTTLVVESRPTGATVRLNGRVIGTTPLTLTPAEAGDFPMTIELPGFRRWSTSVKIVKGQRTRVGASLEQ